MTSDLEGAGTSAVVVMQICGSKGGTGALELSTSALATSGDSSGTQQQQQQGTRGASRLRGREGQSGAGGMFHRGSLDVFRVAGLSDVGSFSHLMVGLMLGAGQHNGE
jgi:hypothetical protein